MSEMEAWMKYATPGAGHKVLEQYVGTWDAETAYSPAPGAEAMTGTAVSEDRLVLGGRFVQTRFTGENFEGMGLNGYDNFGGKYVSLWMDSMMTGWQAAEGTYDAKTRTLTLEGEVPNPAAGGALTHFRWVTRFVSPDERTLTIHQRTGDGPEHAALKVTFRRRR